MGEGSSLTSGWITSKATAQTSIQIAHAEPVGQRGVRGLVFFRQQEPCASPAAPHTAHRTHRGVFACQRTRLKQHYHARHEGARHGMHAPLGLVAVALRSRQIDGLLTDWLAP